MFLVDGLIKAPGSKRNNTPVGWRLTLNKDQNLKIIDIEIANAQEIYTSNNPIYQNLLSKKVLIQRQKEKVFSEIEMMPEVVTSSNLFTTAIVRSDRALHYQHSCCLSRE